MPTDLHRAVFHARIEMHARAELHPRINLKRDCCLGAGRDVDTNEFSFYRRDDCLAVRREAVTGHHIARETRFLVVALHRISQPLFKARFQAAKSIAGLGVVPRGEHQPVAVRRNRWPHRTAYLVC
jgi:hypothetical protein